MNDDFLTKFRKAPRREFSAALYERISKPMLTQTKHPTLRTATLYLAAFVLFAVAMFALTPFRAFAEGILHQVGAYAFEQDQPNAGSQSPSAISISKTHDSVSIQSNGDVPVAKDAAGASQLAGFTVLTPAYLPAGYTEIGEWYVNQESNGRIVTHAYAMANHFLSINQVKHTDNQTPRVFVHDQIVDVTVRGHAGVWLPNPAGDAGGKDALVWDENGITYSLVTDFLSRDELMKIADSLGK